MCEEAEAEDGGPPPRSEPPGGGHEREQEREEERRRRGRRANAGVSKWPPGEEESTESGEKEITQLVLFSHPLPAQIERLSRRKTCSLIVEGRESPQKKNSHIVVPSW